MGKRVWTQVGIEARRGGNEAGCEIKFQKVRSGAQGSGQSRTYRKEGRYWEETRSA